MFPEEMYNASAVLKECEADAIIISAKILLYNSEVEFRAITTLEDFLNSKCRSVILIYDSTNIEIYSKDKDYIEQVQKLCIAKNWDNAIIGALERSCLQIK